MTNMPTDLIERLEWYCDDEGFIETIDFFIGILKAAIQDGDSRLQPNKIQRELDKLKKVIDSLSLDARYHIFDQIDMKWPVNRHSRIDENGAIRFDQENDFSRVYFALSQPFSRPNNVTPQKKILMPFLRTLKAKYNIQPGDRERVAQIICEAAGMKCGSSTFRQALEFADEPWMRPFKPK